MTDAGNSSKNESATPKSGREQRTISNILVKPREQLKYAFVFFGGGLAIMTVYICFFLYYLADTIREMATAYAIAPDVAETLSRAIFTASVATIIFAVALTVIMFVSGIALSHRIFGPIVPITRQLEAIRDGHYANRGSLRKRDAFHDIMDLANEAAEALEKRHGSGTDT